MSDDIANYFLLVLNDNHLDEKEFDSLYEFILILNFLLLNHSSILSKITSNSNILLMKGYYDS
jgi:hypothetical protein